MWDLKSPFCQQAEEDSFHRVYEDSLADSPPHWAGLTYRGQSFTMNKHVPFFSNKLET